jgi:hypothetical protein
MSYKRPIAIHTLCLVTNTLQYELDNSVGISTGYGLYNLGAGARDIYLLHIFIFWAYESIPQ